MIWRSTGLKLISHSHNSFKNRCTFIKTFITIYTKLDDSYVFRSTTIIRELAIELG